MVLFYFIDKDQYYFCGYRSYTTRASYQATEMSKFRFHLTADAADADAVSVAAAVNERGLVLLLSSFRHTGCEASTSN